MANVPDNTAGAPTEGLGQNVTFAFNPTNGAPQLGGGDGSLIRAGVIGGGTAGAGATRGQSIASQVPSPGLALLTKVGDTLIGGALKQRQTEAYIQGMQRAMAGEAVTDIAKSEPWYSKLFGQSDTVEGARAYTADTVVQTTAAKMIDQMPELRKMAPQDATKYFTDGVNNALTGDAATDLSIMQSLTRALPAVMRQQTKEHYGYQQETATAAEDSSFKAQTDRLQALGPSLANGYVTSPEFLQAQHDFIASQVPAAGRDIKNWRDAQMDRLVLAAKTGKFHAIAAARIPMGADDANGDPGTSLIDALKPDQQFQVNRAIEQGQQLGRTAWLNQPEVQQQISDLNVRSHTIGRNGSGDTPQMLYDEAVKMNETATKTTGNPVGPWSPAELEALKTGAGEKVFAARMEDYKANQAAVNKATTERDKADAIALRDSNVVNAFQKGDLAGIYSTPGYTKEQSDYTILQGYRKMTPQAQNAALLLNGAYRVDPISKEREDAVGAAVAGGTLDGPTQAAIAQWKGLYDVRPDVAATYYPKWGAKMEQYNHMTQDMGVSPQDAFQDSFVTEKKPAHPDEKVLAATLNEITKKETGLFQTDMHPSSIRYLSRRTDDAAGYWASHLGDPATGATRAYAVTKAKQDFEVIGSYAFGSAKGADKILPWLTKTAGGQMTLPTDTVHQTFNDGVEAFLSGSRIIDAKGTVAKVPGILKGEKPTDISFTPLPTKPGEEPSLAIDAMDKNGASYRGIIPASYFLKYAAIAKQNRANFGAKLTLGQGMGQGKSPGSLWDQEEARAKLGK